VCSRFVAPLLYDIHHSIRCHVTLERVLVVLSALGGQVALLTALKRGHG
jgi:hypothetical protein